MNIIYHKNLDIDQWHKKSISYQMANIGSEISRTINWQNKGRSRHADISFERALELIDLTVAGIKDYARLKEILRMRELLVAWKTGDEYFLDNSDWLKYFNTYVHNARH